MQSPKHDYYSKCSLLNYVPELVDCDNQEVTKYNVERNEEEKKKAHNTCVCVCVGREVKQNVTK